jgi:hypothetical protein
MELTVHEQDVNTASGAVTSPADVVLLKYLVVTAATPVFNFSPLTTGYTGASSVNTSTCAVSGTSPVAYAPDCVGTVTVSLHLQPGTLAQPISLSDNGTDLRNL